MKNALAHETSPAKPSLMLSCGMFAMLLVGLLFSASSQAQVNQAGGVYPLDDSRSVVRNPIVKMEWDHAMPPPGAVDTMRGQMVVDVVLNTSSFQGRQGRIYMTLPKQTFGRVLTRWTPQRGVMLTDQLEDGNRALIWSGTIGGAELTDTLRLTILADGSELWRIQALTYSFEIQITQ